MIRAYTLLVGFALAGCDPRGLEVDAASYTPDTAAIIDGTACGADVFPSALAVLVDAEIAFDFGPDSRVVERLTTVVCTGTLIAPDAVLTAAHCVDPELLTGGFGSVRFANYYVAPDADLGDLALQLPGASLPSGARAVLSTASHPEFRLDALADWAGGLGEFSDIALMFLDSPFRDIVPASVIASEEVDQLVEGAPLDIVGWGLQQDSGIFGTEPTGILGEKTCARSVLNELGAAEMQVGDRGARKCEGDSGGPSFLEVSGDGGTRRRVVGVTSHGYDFNGCSVGGVDTRVDVYLPWLDGALRAGCESGTRSWCDVPGLPAPGTAMAPAADSTPFMPNETEGCQVGAPILWGMALARRRKKHPKPR